MAADVGQMFLTCVLSFFAGGGETKRLMTMAGVFDVWKSSDVSVSGPSCFIAL